jgi:hypothetical protein
MAMFINPMTPTDSGGDSTASRVWDTLRTTPDIVIEEEDK